LLISTPVNYVNKSKISQSKTTKPLGVFNGKMVEIEEFHFAQGMNHYIQPNNLSSALGLAICTKVRTVRIATLPVSKDPPFRKS
jgi:hypothetical protein